MRLRYRLIGFAVSILLLTILCNVIGYVASTRLAGVIQANQTGLEALRNQMQADMMHDALRADVLAALVDVAKEGQPDKAGILQERAGHASVFTQAVADNRALPLAPAVQDAIARMEPSIAAYVKASQEIVDTAYRDPAAAHAGMPHFLDTFRRLGDDMAATSSLIEKGVSQAKADADAATVRSQGAIAVLGTATVITVIVLSALLTRYILRILGADPIEVKALAGAVARGDLHHGTTLRPGDRDSIMAALADMVATLHEAVTHVREASKEVSSASISLQQGNGELSSRTEQQAAAIEETASSMEELTATVRQNAENARQANTLAGATATTATEGGKVVAEVVATMASIRQSSQNVADITALIDSIAFQTNILALNAAVEAARAGEQGRGFAVVASEVRVLAQRSADAARDIKKLVGEATRAVDDGTQLADQAGLAMYRIEQEIRQVTEVMAQISTASAEQSAGIEQVNQAIVQLEQVTQQNAALVEEAAASSESLRDQAAGLNRAVSVFNLQPAAGEPAGFSSAPIRLVLAQPA